MTGSKLKIEGVRAPGIAALEGLVAMRLLETPDPRVVAYVREADRAWLVTPDAAGGERTLWQGPPPGPPSFARTQGRLWCSLPGLGLFEIAATADGVAATLRDGDAAPVLAAVDGALWGLWPGETGPETGSGSGADGQAPGVWLVPPGQPRRAGPVFSRGQRARGLIRDGSGSLVLWAEDAELGFQLWHEDGAGWRATVGQGAARDALNASVRAGLAWQSGLMLAVGLSPTLHARVHHMPLRGELLAIHQSGDFDILCGELRTSPGGLKVPRAGAATPAAWEKRAAFSHLLALDDGSGDVLAGLQRDIGEVAFYRVSPEAEMTLVGEAEGLLEDLVAGPDGPRALLIDLEPPPPPAPGTLAEEGWEDEAETPVAPDFDMDDMMDAEEMAELERQLDIALGGEVEEER